MSRMVLKSEWDALQTELTELRAEVKQKDQQIVILKQCIHCLTETGKAAASVSQQSSSKKESSPSPSISQSQEPVLASASAATSPVEVAVSPKKKTRTSATSSSTSSAKKPLSKPVPDTITEKTAAPKKKTGATKTAESGRKTKKQGKKVKSPKASAATSARPQSTKKPSTSSRSRASSRGRDSDKRPQSSRAAKTEDIPMILPMQIAAIGKGKGKLHVVADGEAAAVDSSATGHSPTLQSPPKSSRRRKGGKSKDERRRRSELPPDSTKLKSTGSKKTADIVSTSSTPTPATVSSSQSKRKRRTSASKASKDSRKKGKAKSGSISEMDTATDIVVVVDLEPVSEVLEETSGKKSAAKKKKAKKTEDTSLTKTTSDPSKKGKRKIQKKKTSSTGSSSDNDSFEDETLSEIPIVLSPIKSAKISSTKSKAKTKTKEKTTATASIIPAESSESHSIEISDETVSDPRSDRSAGTDSPVPGGVRRAHHRRRRSATSSRSAVKRKSSHTRLNTMDFVRRQRDAVLMKKRLKKEALRRGHPFLEINAVSEYRDSFHLKLVDLDMGGGRHRLPLIWKCLFLHQLAAAFSDLAVGGEEKECVDGGVTADGVFTFEPLADGSKKIGGGAQLKVCKTTKLSSSTLPLFVHDFAPSLSMSEYIRANGMHDASSGLALRDHVFCYRVRRWCDGFMLPYAVAAASDLRPGQWLLTDDMICIQNAHCCSDEAPTWHSWLDATASGQLSGLLKDGGLIDANEAITVVRVEDGVEEEDLHPYATGMCKNGERLLIGAMKAGFDYQRIRVDALAPALFRFCGQSPPVVNLGRGVRQSLLYADDSHKLAHVSSTGICFENMVRYLSLKTPPATIAAINMEPLTRGRGFDDVWTLAFSFSHPLPSKFKHAILYKKGSIEIEVEGEAVAGRSGVPQFSGESLNIRLFDGDSLRRQLSIGVAIRGEEMKDESVWTYTVDGENVEWFPLDYGNAHNVVVCKYVDGRVRVILDEVTVYCDESAPETYSTNLLQPAPSPYLLLGHKAADEDCPPGKVFNGHIFDLALYPWVFCDFELKQYTTRCMQHIARYKEIAAKEDVFGENY